MRIPVFMLLLLTATAVTAQEGCDAHGITRRWLVQHGRSIDLHGQLHGALGGLRKGGSEATIPVVVHVVWNTPAENVASSTILAMIGTLNADHRNLNSDLDNVRPAFAADRGNPDITFCLASVDPDGNPTTGITRTQTTETWFDPANETDLMKSPPKGISPWDPASYLNIWICDITSGAGGGPITQGYAYLPVDGMVGSAVDGIVIDVTYGLQPGSRTATHEAGHYLGLMHPYGDGGCGSDDGMADTPVTDEPTLSCSDTGLANCGALTQYENFMDQAVCRMMFTNDQSTRMNTVLFGVRYGLLAGGGCGGATTGPCIPAPALGTSAGDFLDGVWLEGINNTGTGAAGGPAYVDYTAQGTELLQGSTHAITLTAGASSGSTVAAWIDMDASSTFDSTELLGEAVVPDAHGTATFTFTVPADATPGPTRLRARCMRTADGTPASADPCAAFTYGETEDYSVVIGLSTGMTSHVAAGLSVRYDPADGRLWMVAGEGGVRELMLFDAVGRCVARQRTEGPVAPLDVHGLASGYHILRAVHKGRVVTVPFVVR